MELNKIMSAELIDILFEGKNKEYGAYELRKTYNRRIAMAIAGMAMVCVLFFLSQIFASDKGKYTKPILVKDVLLTDVKPKEKVPEPIQLPPPKAEVPRVATVIFTPPAIVRDIDVTDPPPAMDDMEHKQIGLINQDGLEDVDAAAPPVEISTGVTIAPKNKEIDYDGKFTKVEKEASFPGGMDGWKRYLQRSLNANVASDEGAPIGNYTVQVQFVVDKEGGISNVQAIEVPKACPACGPEAVRVIKNGPKWEPAIQNGRKVNYQAIQNVTFQVAEE